MNHLIKRLTAFVLAVMLSLAVFAGFGISASADTVDQTDAYVLNFNPTELTADYAYNRPYWYTTPFTVNHTITKPDGTEYYSGGNFPEVFNLINTTKLADGGEGAYASILAYCTDASTGTRGDTSYRRINLEDSSYYASGVAGRIRAVFLRGFPMNEVVEIQESANVWLRAQGKTELQQLQSGEAILATQIAIWQLSNGDHYTVNSYFDGMQDLNEAWLEGYLSDEVIDPSTATQLETEYTASNIENLCAYYMNLAPMAPQYDAVSEASFEDLVYTVAKNDDGSYTITVAFSVNTMIGDGDTLTLSASCGGEVQSIRLTQAGDYTFTFAGVDSCQPVKLEINGWQNGGDVYLFDAQGDRSASQSMVGYDNSCLPVHGEVIASPDRILNIQKTTTDEDAMGKIPLTNIEFDLYLVATMEQIESTDPNIRIELSEKPTAEEIAMYQNPENLIATLITDSQGNAAYNFTENGNPDGVYMIVERASTATTGPVEPFFVIIPGTNETGDGYAYTVNVSPKNTTEPGPDIQKDVTRLDNNSDTYDVGQEHLWIIRGGVPTGIGNAESYIITDTIDYRLTYSKGSPVVKLYTTDGTELELLSETDYALTEGSVEKDFGEAGLKTVDRFVIALTAQGMKKVAENLGSGTETPEIRVYFKAVINSNALMGENIPNQSSLEYTNSAGVDYTAESDIPEVHTGGIRILKTDTEGNGLSRAVFKIARAATEAEREDSAIVKEKLTVDGQTLDVVFVDFYAREDLTGEKDYQVETDENGEAILYGLAYGTYYIVETKAPEGYNLLTAPITVQITATSHLAAEDGVEDVDGVVIDSLVTVVNTKFVLPETGGMGTALFTLGGAAMMSLAGALLLTGRKKKA